MMCAICAKEMLKNILIEMISCLWKYMDYETMNNELPIEFNKVRMLHTIYKVVFSFPAKCQ